MKPPSFRGKPSKAHVLWRREGAGDAVDKRFDEDALREWCTTRGVDFETDKRVDHRRSDQPRPQFRLVFARSESESESFTIGDDEWEIQAGETPRTFLEIDSAGEARLKGWSGEHVLDLEEMWLEDDGFVIEADGLDGPKRLDARRLKSNPTE